jgi:glycine cleavage system H protein
MRIDQNCRYTKTHEWVRVMPDGKSARAGITDYAQEQLSDIVYVEMPEAGDTFKAGDSFAVAESVKATSDCYMAVGGTVTATNDELSGSPQLVNEEPYDGGWFIEFTLTDPKEVEKLMTPAEYEKYAAEEAAKGGH